MKEIDHENRNFLTDAYTEQEQWSDFAYCKNCKDYDLKGQKCLLDGKSYFPNTHRSCFVENTEREGQEEIEEKVIQLTGLRLTNYSYNVKQFWKIQPFFFDENKSFWFWQPDKFLWKRVDETDLIVAIGKALDFGGELVTTGVKNNYLEAFRQIGRVKIPKEQPKYWIQFRDQIYDLLNERVIPATPEYFITNPIPWKLEGNGMTPKIEELFNEWVGEDQIELLYEIIAYCILPDYPIQRLFCLFGDGANGKSCFINLLYNFIGRENITACSIENLTSSRFEKARLYKKLVCFMNETNFDNIKKTATIKELTGNEPIVTFEFKNKTPFVERNYAKLIIATNNIPPVDDKTPGWYRRWLIVDFPNTFTEERDVLSEIPKSEYNSLAMKSVIYLQRLIKKRSFTNEGSVSDRAKKFEEKSNPFEKFWEENIKEDGAGHIFKFDFRKKLQSWLKENKFREISDRTISKYMKEKGIEDMKKLADWHNSDGVKPQYRAWGGIIWA